MRLDFSNIGKGLSGIADAITERKRREQLEALGPSAEAVAGTGYEVIDPQGRVTRGLATPDVDIAAARQAYEQAGYQLRPVEGPGLGQQYAARAGSRDIGTYGTEAEAERAAARYDVGLTRRRADVYTGTGDKELAERLRQQAGAESRALGAEDRAAAAEARSAETFGFQRDKLVRDRNVQSIQDRIAQMGDADLEGMAGRLNTNQSQLPMLYTGKTKDGYTFLTTDSSGKPGESITYTPAQLRRLAMANALFDSGYAAEGLAELDKVDKSLADRIGARNALVQATGTSMQGAERLGLTAGSMAAQNARYNTAGLSSYGNMVAGRLKTLDSTIANQAEFRRLPPDQQRAIVAERNDLNQELAAISGQLRSGFNIPTASGPRNDTAAALALAETGINPNTNAPFTAAEKDEFTRRFGVPFPEPKASKAQGTRAGGPRAPRSGSSSAMFPSRGLQKAGATKDQIDQMTLQELQEYNRSGTIPQRLVR